MNVEWQVLVERHWGGSAVDREAYDLPKVITYPHVVQAVVDAMNREFDQPAVAAACCFVLWNLAEALEYEAAYTPKVIGRVSVPVAVLQA